MTLSRRSFISLVPSAALLTCYRNAEAQSADAPFSFAVLGGDSETDGDPDGFSRIVAEINSQPLAFVVNAGDSGMSACSSESYRERREALGRIRHAVIYTPGDGDWYECIGQTGDNRLDDLRDVFFRPPGRSLGGRPIDLETQATSSDFGEFAENARYVHGKLVITTLHLLRSDRDGTRRGDSRRRADAAIAWLYNTMQTAAEADARAGVIVLHAEMPDGVERATDGYDYDGVHWALIEVAQHAPVPLLVIHAGTEGYAADRPFRDPVTGRTISNLQRLRTLSSQNAGWIKVDVDTALEQPFGFEVRTASR